MSAGPAHAPQDRLRRTLELRGRPLKLNVGRLLKEFGRAADEERVGEAMQATLADAGVRVRPSLENFTADQMITLELADVDSPEGPPTQDADPAGAEHVPQSPAEQVRPDTPRPPSKQQPHAAEDRSADPATSELRQSLFVRAAVEAERSVRDGYVRAREAAAERIAALERELTTEREATARARDERDELERRMHEERRDAATRIQALAAAERTARSLLEAQRTELSNLTHAVRVSSATIGQARDALEEMHTHAQQAAAEVRETLETGEALQTPAEPQAAG